jgi:hypothetical protein
MMPLGDDLCPDGFLKNGCILAFAENSLDHVCAGLDALLCLELLASWPVSLERGLSVFAEQQPHDVCNAHMKPYDSSTHVLL